MKYLKIKDIKNRERLFFQEKKKLIKKTLFINFLNVFSNHFKKKSFYFFIRFYKKIKMF